MADKEQDPQLVRLLRILRMGRLNPDFAARELMISLQEAQTLLKQNSGSDGPLLESGGWFGLRNPPPPEPARQRDYAPPPSREKTAERLGLGQYRQGPPVRTQEWYDPPRSRPSPRYAPPAVATPVAKPLPFDPHRSAALDLLQRLGAPGSVTAAVQVGNYAPANLYVAVQSKLVDDSTTRLEAEMAGLRARIALLAELGTLAAKHE